ncbi:inner membrane protein [Legionella santicrucis]|uniref:Inner membrane protein n=1 Tax=Legionella santicrucis TaxID=45074 RepID=A0A0W0Z2A7_9GAMM|nr:inner membrane protein [Legionella santicrucis]
MAKAVLRANVGQEIRLADIEADAGAGMGLFERLHNHPNPASLAINLNENANRFYGAVGMKWLENLVSNRQMLIPIMSNRIKQFVDNVINQEATGQITRVARRFALVATG